MRKLLTALRSAPKRITAPVAMLTAAVIIPAVLFAWGPDRPTFTVAHPADHVTFNSITDNPVIGDERNFVNVKDAANTQDGGWQDNITVQPGKEYLVRVYVHNNAATELNLKATNTRVSASVPTTTGTNVSVSGFVSADNASPARIWDDIHFNSTQQFNLAYVNGSARIYNNGYAKGGNGQPLPDDIVTNAGDLIGYNGPDGIVPGCFQYDNFVYFKVKPQFAPTANFTVTKQVRKSGTSSWQKSVAVNPGEKVDYLVSYKNTGDAQQNNVTLKDTLPTGETYVAGTTQVVNSTQPNGTTVRDDVTTTTGLNIGNYNGGAAAYTKFTAKVADNDQLATCGVNTLTNTARIETDYGFKTDTADVTVTKTCATPSTIQVCDLTTKKTVTINENQFDAKKYSKNLKDCETTSVTPPVTPTTPTVPTELPHTGASDGIIATIGAGSLVASIGYYVASRRNLLN